MIPIVMIITAAVCLQPMLHNARRQMPGIIVHILVAVLRAVVVVIFPALIRHLHHSIVYAIQD